MIHKLQMYRIIRTYVSTKVSTHYRIWILTSISTGFFEKKYIYTARYRTEKSERNPHLFCCAQSFKKTKTSSSLHKLKKNFSHNRMIQLSLEMKSLHHYFLRLKFGHSYDHYHLYFLLNEPFLLVVEKVGNEVGIYKLFDHL